MENRLYPTWEQLEQQNNPLTAGEKSLIKYLDTYLPKDLNWKKEQGLKNYNGWLIFAQPFLNGTRPDIIIFDPQVGLVIYEVKDWDLDNYEWKKGKGLFVNDGRGSYPVKNPIDQVEHYKERLIGQLVPNNTALTRTRENLIILNANKRYDNFGEKFPKKWNEQ